MRQSLSLSISEESLDFRSLFDQFDLGKFFWGVDCVVERCFERFLIVGVKLEGTRKGTLCFREGVAVLRTFATSRRAELSSIPELYSS